MENKKILPISLVASFLLATNLYSKPEELSTITVVSATKSEQSIKDVTSDIEVITKEELEEKHYTTISEALSSISGISTVSNGSMGNATSVFLRGMSTQRILVLIDGIRYQDPSNTSGASFAHLIMDDIQRIEIVKGAQSGIWGSDAAAGVINIITKEAKDGINATINSELGSFNTKKFGVSVSNKTNKYDIRLSANRLLTDGFSAQSPRHSNVDDYEKDGYSNTTINFKTNYYLSDDDKISAIINHINSYTNYDGWNAPNAKQSSKNKSNLYALAYNKKYKNHNIRLDYNLSKFEKEELQASGAFQVRDYNGSTQLIELLDSISYFEKDNLTAGLNFEKDKVDYAKGDFSTNNEDTKNKAIFITNTNHFDNITFTQSLRRDDYSNFGGKTTGKVGLKYNFNEDLSFKTNYGTAYNAPNIIQMLNPWGTSNLNLKPEETKSFDISANYKSFTITYFDNKIKNLIDWNANQYQNISGTSNIKGYEFKYTNNIIEDTLMSLNYTHLNAENKAGQDLARRPKRELSINLDYYGINKFHFNLNGTYVGTRYDAVNKGGTQTGKYTVWNGVINYDLNKDTEIYLKLNNIFDKYYQTVDGYSSESRSAYLGLKYSF